MKHLSPICFVLIVILAAGVLLAAPVPVAQAADKGELSSLLDELSQKVDTADKKMVAHPKFIEELRALITKYRNRIRTIFLEDTFQDGEFQSNPRWTVRKGSFTVNAAGRLQSRAYSYGQEEQQAAPQEEEEREPFQVILGEILKTRKGSQDRDEAPRSRESREEEAALWTAAKISPDFEVNLTVVSQSEWGSMEIVLLGGNPLKPRYRLVYQPSPSDQRPIEIIRERDGRRYTIESATVFPDMDDGRKHTLRWTRNQRGDMAVLVDGKKVLTTVELYYRDDFGGIELVNRGGSYEWGPVRVMQAEKAQVQ
jgi:hypothetical protein